MSKFVNSTSGKKVRIWGTNEPSENLTISKDIIIQHWQYGEPDPIKLQEEGYQFLNSEDWWAYMSLKNDHMPITPPLRAILRRQLRSELCESAELAMEPGLVQLCQQDRAALQHCLRQKGWHHGRIERQWCRCYYPAGSLLRHAQGHTNCGSESVVRFARTSHHL
jgi:hypothetical protein